MFDLFDKKILILLSHKKFQDEEYQTLSSFLNNCNARTIIASSSCEPAEGVFGTLVTPDILISDAKFTELDAIILIGGVGSIEYWHNTSVHNLVKNANREEKIIGAICLAPVILANAGLLENKRATAYNSAKNFLIKKGIKYTGNSVEISGNIITANGPEATKEFAETIAGQLGKHSQILNI